ncbi:ActS/PrrB/RegB family redox-sensitive histidine kinase [Hyphomicrobiales bacterium]|jgi:two-component system sensor histidine kinase RegB|nr:ActS/PrrB/RegB family redox-sensitive histidine kinase [Hyphomicrobiales bacterium]MDA9033970.1 ActS/PrrB/RegB family redox-sensitive histidine kinase [Hyphomicrobiales bacterium]MDA9904080.1 ActS/PrrB/RegB family redox-sensitive histidine kinase [Hyphomicrobiales bacterium]|tara:strand:- start:1603 stop:2892 length:1290 start_codon:yes stop_codon:yes gene_type:complete
MENVEKEISSLGLGIRAKTLINLRWIAVLGQTITCLVVEYFFGFQLPWLEILLTVLALIISNIALYPRYSTNNRLSETATTVVIAADILQLALLIFFTGGLSNPFVVLFITPIAITVTSLPIRSTSILIFLTIIFITILGSFNYPLESNMLDLSVPPIFILGMWVSLFVTILFLTFYAGGLTDESRKISAALKVAENLLVKEKNLSSLDGLAAAAAHHLGTPLGTISLIANELKNDESINENAKKDLMILSEEVDKCKKILGSLGEKPSSDDDLITKIELQALLEELCELIKVKEIKFSINFNDNDPGMKEILLRRRSELLLGLSNIIENAADFASTTVELNVSKSGKFINLEINDDGKGFSNSILSRIGDPYVSSRSKSSNNGDGLGLGFFISKTLLERLNISVQAYNKVHPEHGAVVLIKIPYDVYS